MEGEGVASRCKPSPDNHDERKRKKNKMKKLLLATALCALAAPAYAGPVTLLSVGLPDPQAFDAGTELGYSYYDGPVELTTQDGTTLSKFLAYCVDLNHVLHSDLYTYGDLTENGAGVSLTQAQSNRIGQIAIAGFAAEGLPTPDGTFAAAAQLAIWDVAYGVAPTFLNEAADPGLTFDFNFLMSPAFQTNTGTYATAFIPTDWPGTGASQEMVIGLEVSTPELSTWAMMGAGFALMGAFSWKRRRTPRYAV